MTENNRHIDISELSNRILIGTRKAVQKLIKYNAANGADMVIGDVDGNFKIVSAKELLRSPSK
jgi:hypothetical protein